MNTCMITLDIINAICHPDGQLARYSKRIQQNNMITTINRALAWARDHELLIAHVRLGFRPGYQDGSSRSPVFSQLTKNKLLTATEWDSQFCDELAVEQSDIEIIKHRVSAFYGTDLDLILRANRIDKIILCGVATNNAVELTAREAHDRDYFVTVIEDATESANDEDKQASFKFLQRITQLVPVNSLTL